MIGQAEQFFPMTARVDSTAKPTYYVGMALPGALTSDAVWQIMRVDVTAGATVLWANGNREFTNVWDNRTSLVYS